MTDPGMADEALMAVLPRLAHGLKRPLSTILLSADVLQGHGLAEDDVRQIAAGILGSAREAIALADDLVDLLRLETGMWVLAPGSLDLAPVLRSVLDDVPVGVSVAARADGPLHVMADRDGLKRLLSCLVAQVLGATLAGDGIDIACGGGPDQLDLSIHTATGTPAGGLDSVFEPFAPILGPPGLALPLARRLAEAQAGRLVVRGSEDEGTTFVLSLPRPPGNVP